jgi:hypothetical protein
MDFMSGCLPFRNTADSVVTKLWTQILLQIIAEMKLLVLPKQDKRFSLPQSKLITLLKDSRTPGSFVLEFFQNLSRMPASLQGERIIDTWVCRYQCSTTNVLYSCLCVFDSRGKMLCRHTSHIGCSLVCLFLSVLVSISYEPWAERKIDTSEMLSGMKQSNYVHFEFCSLIEVIVKLNRKSSTVCKADIEAGIFLSPMMRKLTARNVISFLLFSMLLLFRVKVWNESELQKTELKVTRKLTPSLTSLFPPMLANFISCFLRAAPEKWFLSVGSS